MNYGQILLATGVVVIVGRWRSGKSLDPSLAVATFFLYFFLTIMSDASPELADSFAMLILVTALLVYGEAVFKGLF